MKFLKNIFSLVFVGLLIFACKEKFVEKPNKFIEKEQMQDILYDLNLLQALKYQYSPNFDPNSVKPFEIVCKKYKIDTLQLRQNIQYYSEDYKLYSQMMSEIDKKLKEQKMVLDSVENPLKKENLELEKAELENE